MARAYNALTGRFGTHSLPSKDKYGIITMGTHLDRDWMGRRPANEGGSSPLINWGPGGGLAYTPATHIGSLLSHQLLSVSPVPLILLPTAPSFVPGPLLPHHEILLGTARHSPAGHRGGHVTQEDQSESFLWDLSSFTKGRILSLSFRR